jgi:hypothetical protein
MNKTFEECQYTTGTHTMPQGLFEKDDKLSGAGSVIDDIAAITVLAKDCATLDDALRKCREEGRNCAEVNEFSQITAPKAIADITLGVNGAMAALWNNYGLGNYFKESLVGTALNKVKTQARQIANTNTYIQKLGKFMHTLKLNQFTIIDTTIDVVITNGALVDEAGQLVYDGGNWYWKGADGAF